MNHFTTDTVVEGIQGSLATSLMDWPAATASNVAFILSSLHVLRIPNLWFIMHRTVGADLDLLLVVMHIFLWGMALITSYVA